MALENQLAGAEAGQIKSAEHSFWSWVRARRAPEPMSAPAPKDDPLQEAIDSLENELNRKRTEFEALCERVRPNALASEALRLRGAERVAIDQFLRDWSPVVAEMKAEFTELQERHRALLAQRSAGNS